jgi:hypothetical protein
MNLLKRLFGLTTSIEHAAPATGKVALTPEEQLSSLNPDQRLATIMTIGDTGLLTHYALLKHSILTDPDRGIRFAALKRIHLFKEHPDLLSFLQNLYASEENSGLEPYLSMALGRVGLISLEELQSRINGS